MSASPTLSPAPAKHGTSLPRRLFRWALAAIVVVMLLFAIAVWNNNHSLHKRSRAEFNAQLDHAIETSTQWTVTNPVNYGNPPLMFMVGDMADMSGDPRLQQYVQGYLASKWVHVPGQPMTWFYAHWASPSQPVPVIPRAQVPYLGWQDRWFGYASAPDKIELTPQDRADLFSPTKYSWGVRLHLQLVALDMYRHFNLPSPELDRAINPVSEGVANDAKWDFRVSDSYEQRIATLLAAGRPDLVKARWVERLLDNQRPDGTWNYCWYGWCRGVLEFRLKPPDDYGHSTVQAAWALYQLKYKYSDWIAKNYQ